MSTMLGIFHFTGIIKCLIFFSTVLAVAGPTFVVVGGDTRLSNGGYGISSRNVPKLFSM
jgi:20S proteasome alpha/beta subunit